MRKLRISKIGKTIVCLLIMVFCMNNLVTCNAVNPYSIDQLWTKITSSNDVLIIDVRPSDQYFNGHIPTAINIPYITMNESSIIGELNSYGKSEIIVYCTCTNGDLALQFANSLESLGMSHVNYMSENYQFWPYQVVTGNNPGDINETNLSQLSSNTTNKNMSLGNAFNLFLILDILLGIGLVVGLIIKKSR